MPGPPKNLNNFRHGLHSAGLPTGCSAIGKALLAFRRHLEAACFDRHGAIDLVRAASVATAVAWERHRRLADRWLRLEADKMSAADRLNYSRESARASEQRDKAIAALGIDAKSIDPISEAIQAAHAGGSLIIPLAAPASPASPNGYGSPIDPERASEAPGASGRQSAVEANHAT